MQKDCLNDKVKYKGPLRASFRMLDKLWQKTRSSVQERERNEFGHSEWVAWAFLYERKAARVSNGIVNV